MDTFLRENLEWLSRATNWAKFSATAGLGVIHRGQLGQGKALLAPYLPRDGAGGSPYSEGGALYALGLIAANHGAQHRAFLLESLRAAGSPVIQHGACLGLGEGLGDFHVKGGAAAGLRAFRAAGAAAGRPLGRGQLPGAVRRRLCAGALAASRFPPTTALKPPLPPASRLPTVNPAGLACLGTCDEEAFEDLKNTLYTDDAVAGEVGGTRGRKPGTGVSTRARRRVALRPGGTRGRRTALAFACLLCALVRRAQVRMCPGRRSLLPSLAATLPHLPLSPGCRPSYGHAAVWQQQRQGAGDAGEGGALVEGASRRGAKNLAAAGQQRRMAGAH